MVAFAVVVHDEFSCRTVPLSAFVVVAAGRSLFRLADLLELAQRIRASSPEQPEKSVKGKMS
jgi:hypothetical protein